uniref:Uncharacterized protein n=1 Tax=Arundo donax TaxID=35708 RepID=A0A0A9FVK1_ARUDO
MSSYAVGRRHCSSRRCRCRKRRRQRWLVHRGALRIGLNSFSRIMQLGSNDCSEKSPATATSDDDSGYRMPSRTGSRTTARVPSSAPPSGNPHTRATARASGRQTSRRSPDARSGTSRPTATVATPVADPARRRPLGTPAPAPARSWQWSAGS